jgi:hypothetical protein
MERFPGVPVDGADGDVSEVSLTIPADSAAAVRVREGQFTRHKEAERPVADLIARVRKAKEVCARVNGETGEVTLFDDRAWGDRPLCTPPRSPWQRRMAHSPVCRTDCRVPPGWGW